MLNQACRAAAPAVQGVSQTPASFGAPLPSGSKEKDDGLPGAGQTGDDACLLG
jgi:hypothetical protein